MVAPNILGLSVETKAVDLLAGKKPPIAAPAEGTRVVPDHHGSRLRPSAKRPSRNPLLKRSKGKPS
jgi:hypothetical protein